MLGRAFIIFGVLLLIGSLILAAVRGQEDTVGVEKMRSTFAFLLFGFIFLGSGIAIKLVNGFFNTVDKVNNFVESDEGKKLIAEAQKNNNDPLGIRDEND